MLNIKGKAADKETSPRRWPGIAVSLTVLALVLLYLLSAEDTIDVRQSAKDPPVPPVSVEKLSRRAETVKITTFAAVRPRWSAELRAAVSGRVANVLDSALVGERVDAGTALLNIEDSAYVADVSAAELATQEARLILLRAQKATVIAREQFERDGKTPPNDLALHLPQLRIAEIAVKAAKARVAAARQRLQDTVVTAPFSGFVTERFVSPGQMVSSGDALLKLVDDSVFELTAELSRRDWLLLAPDLTGSEAAVLDQDGDTVARAVIRRSGGFLDEHTRQYKVFLEIDNGDRASLLSGDFVRVVLPGISVPAALNIPESALTREGYMWYVDGEDRLRRSAPEVLFRRHDRIIVQAPQDTDEWRIALTPLVSFLQGQQVRPQLLEN